MHSARREQAGVRGEGLIESGWRGQDARTKQEQGRPDTQHFLRAQPPPSNIDAIFANEGEVVPSHRH